MPTDNAFRNMNIISQSEGGEDGGKERETPSVVNHDADFILKDQ